MSINGMVDVTGAHELKVSIGSGSVSISNINTAGGSIPVGTKGVEISRTFNRPANTTTYTANTTVNTATAASAANILFAGCAGLAGGGGKIFNAVMSTSKNASGTGRGEYQLLLFNTNPAIANDNAAVNILDSEILTCIGVINFYQTLGNNFGNNVHYTGVLQNGVIGFVTSGSADLYGVLVVTNAYAPDASETYKISLQIDQN
jgi:hypothetical protein